MNYDNVVNQEIKGKFIQREVLACFSYEMDAVLKASSNWIDKDNPLPSYDEIENLYVHNCPECGHSESCSDMFLHPSGENGYKCPNCQHEFTEETEAEPQEIMEWWIVTEYLYRKLKAKGEPVLEWGNNYYWGRTCSGQAILLDSVISFICSDMDILEGQSNDWSKFK